VRTGSRAARLIALLLGGLLVTGYAQVSILGLGIRSQRMMAVIQPPFLHSDIYGPWYGARELLAGRDPYDAARVADLFVQVYGEPLVLPLDVLHPLFFAFFYPPYVAALLAPLLPFSCAVARQQANGQQAIGLLIGAIAGAAVLWARLCAGRSGLGWVPLVAIAGGSLLFYPSLDTLWLQKLSGLVLFLIVAAYALAARQRHLPAGLLLWSQWRLPTWLPEFFSSSQRYTQSDGVDWVPAQLTGGSWGGLVLLAGAGTGLGLLWWRRRHLPATDCGVLSAFALTMAARALLIPDFQYGIYYNRAFLLLPILATVLVGPVTGAVESAARALALAGAAVPVLLLGLAFWLAVVAPPAEVADTLVIGAYSVLDALPLLSLPGAILLAVYRRPACSPYLYASPCLRHEGR
jgi:hypothetical protein